MNQDDIGLWRQLFFVIINGLSIEKATEDELAQAATIFWEHIQNRLSPEALPGFSSATEIIKTEAILEQSMAGEIK
jgi:hypothetical protein